MHSWHDKKWNSALISSPGSRYLCFFLYLNFEFSLESQLYDQKGDIDFETQNCVNWFVFWAGKDEGTIISKWFDLPADVLVLDL